MKTVNVLLLYCCGFIRRVLLHTCAFLGVKFWCLLILVCRICLVTLVGILAYYILPYTSLSLSMTTPSPSTIMVSEFLFPINGRLYLGRGIFWQCCCSYLGCWWLFHMWLVLHWWCWCRVQLSRWFGCTWRILHVCHFLVKLWILFPEWGDFGVFCIQLVRWLWCGVVEVR